MCIRVPTFPVAATATIVAGRCPNECIHGGLVSLQSVGTGAVVITESMWCEARGAGGVAWRGGLPSPPRVCVFVGGWW